MRMANTVPPKLTVTVTNRTVLRVIALIIGSVLLVQLLGRMSHVLTLIFAAFFLALALNPAVNWISRQLQIKSRVRATGIAYLLVIVSLVVFFSLVIPPLVRQTANFIDTVPQTVNNFQTQDSSVARFARKYNLDDKLNEFGREFSNRAGNYTGPVLDTASRLAGAIVSLLAVLVLTFMMLVEGPVWLERILSYVPARRREHHKKIAMKMYRIVTGYVNGQVLIAAIAAGFAMVVLFISSNIFNVSVNPIALGGIVFLFGLIPMIGNTLAAVIVSLVCLFSSVGLALTVLVFFLIYQQIENATLQPYIQAKNNELTPLLVFVAALLGAGFGGILGAFVAIPAAGCFKILLEDYLTRKKLTPETETA